MHDDFLVNRSQRCQRVLTISDTLPVLGAILFVGLVLLLFTVNLASFPLPWFDEGYFTATARVLAETGRYGLPDSSGIWEMDPSITSGPVLIGPIALVFRLFGVGLLQARLVAVLAALASAAIYTVLARRLVGGSAGWLALALLLAGSPELYVSFVYLGRQAIGEVPAFGLLLLGIWLWLKAQDRHSATLLVAAGLALGLSAVVKPQMVVGIAPMLVGICLLDRLYYRQAGWLAYLIPALVAALCVLAWMGTQLLVLGLDTYLAKSAVLSSGVSSNILSFDPVHVRNAIGTLWRSGFILWGLPGLGYGIWLARRRDAVGLAHGWLVVLVICWLAWFLVLSIGWARYAFVPLAILPIWTAGLLRAGMQGLPRIGRFGLVLALSLLLLFNSSALLTGMLGTQSYDAARFSDAIAAYVPEGAVVESWEWELDTLATANFHHPEPQVMYAYIDAMQSAQPRPSSYDPAAAQPAYLVDGPFSSWTGIYQQFIREYTTRVITVGRYTLYQVRL